jgi:phosphoribosyl-AMP cyclohydrolase
MVADPRRPAGPRYGLDAGHPRSTGDNGPVNDSDDPTAVAVPAPPNGSGSLDPGIAARLKRDAAGLVAAVVQDQTTSEVLMVGWMDDEALHRTLASGRSTFYSRSRQEYWVKGETSGHRQWVHEVRLDCDGDTVLVKVRQEGPACHTGTRTCFDAVVLPAALTDPIATVER